MISSSVKHQFSVNQNKGFTLVELLVITAVLAILVSLQILALSSAKQKVEDGTCLNNFRLLTAGWQAYSKDNSGRLVFCPDTSDDKAWVFGDMNYSGGMPSGADTNSGFLLNSNYALMGPYTKNPRLYKCPLDLSCTSGKTGIPRNRSVSLSQAVGLRPDGKLANSGVWLDGGSGHGSWTVFAKESDINKIGAKNLWVFTEEHPDSMNDGGFGVRMDIVSWIDYPSYYHNNSGIFSFADGHVEFHKFTKLAAIPKISYQFLGIPITVANNEDVIWIQHHTSCK